MPTRIKHDAGFIPCPVDNGDEIFRNGIFEFNISKLTGYLHRDASDVMLEAVYTNTFPAEFSTIDETHLEYISLDNLVIVAEIAPQQFNLIDGHHRTEKARRTGVELLSGYTLRVDQHIKFLTSREAYDAYVEY